jgi:ribosome-binding factor A
MTSRRTPGGAGRRYPRSARVNEVIREVLATEIERLADTDERLVLLTVTSVESDPDLRRAKVLFASLEDDAREALEESRIRLQALLASQVRMRWTPQLSFAADPVISNAQRVEDLLRQLRTTGEGDGHDPE